MSKCPNINLQEWKDLVKTHGELEAYAIYIENNYEIPTETVKTFNWSVSNINREASKDLKNVTNVRANILASLVNKVNIYQGPKDEAYIKSIKNLIDTFVENDIGVALRTFIENAEKTIAEIPKAMDANANSLKLLHQLHNYSGTYQMLEDVSQMLEKTNVKDLAIFKERINNIMGKLVAIDKKYTNYARMAIATKLAADSTIMRQRERYKLNKEYSENNPFKESTLPRKKYDQAKHAWVNLELNKRNDEIFQKEKNYILDLLETAPKDITSVSRTLIDPRNINDHIVQLSVKLLDRADFKAKETFIKDRERLLTKWRKFTEGKKTVITKPRDLYEGIIEKINGKETNYYVRENYSTFYEARQEMFQEYHRLEREVGLKEARVFIKAWIKENMKAPEVTTEMAKELKELGLPITGNVDIYDDSQAAAKWKNPQWKELQKNKEKKEIYDFLINFNKESDEMINSRAALGYRLPSITKKSGELLMDVGVRKGLWEGVSSKFNMRVDDWKFGETDREEDVVKVIKGEDGKALKRIAIPFRGDLEPDNQSYDLLGMALVNRFVSLNYKEKLNIQNDLEILEHLMGERDIEVRKNNKKFITRAIDIFNVSKEELIETTELLKGDQSNSFRAMQSILEDRLYGKHDIATIVGKISIDKLANFATGIAANNMLIANFLGGGANVLVGQVNNFLEGTRRIHYDRRNLRRADSKYFGDTGKVINDFGKQAPTSKTNLLLDKFLDTSMGFSAMSNNLANDTRLKKVLNVNTLHGVNNMAEHYIQGKLLYAITDNIKVTNKFGEYVNKKGEVVEDRNEAMTLDENYVLKDGLLVFQNSEELTIEGFDEFNSEAELFVQRKVKDVTADLQGNYDENNKANVQRYFYGKLAFFLRKWMIRGIQKRWSGIGNSGKQWDGLEEFEKFYSESAQEYKEGTYTSLIRYMMAIKQHGNMLKAEIYSKQWDTLSDMEKGNIRAAVTELSIMVLTISASALLANLADDDDEYDNQVVWHSAYWMRRLYGELLFFTPLNPFEVLRVMKTPTASLTTVEMSLNILLQLGGDIFGGELERYEGGKHKGESKLYVQSQKLFNPFYKNLWTRDAQKSYEYLKNIRN